MRRSRRAFLKEGLLVGAIGLAGCAEDGSGPPTSASSNTATSTASTTVAPETSSPSTTDSPRETDGAEVDGLRFEVTVPDNTQPADRIFVILFRPNGVIPHEMERVDESVFRRSFELSYLEQGEDNGEAVVHYRYDRNGQGVNTMEYLVDDRGDEIFPTADRLGRTAPFRAGVVQRDTVSQWRWMPPDGTPVPIESEISPTSPWSPRVSGESFRLGQYMQDLYSPWYDAHFQSSARRLTDRGHNWVALSPPWQWVDDDPPQLGNALALGIPGHPNYPDDEKLIEHIRAFDSAGLEVHLEPQICCIGIDRSNRSASWWQTYADEVEAFLVHHAQVAERAGATSFGFEPFGLHNSNHPESEKRIDEMLAAVSTSFSGELTTKVMIFIVDGENRGIIPEAEAFSWGDGIDYFILATDAKVVESSDPTDAELKEGAGAVLDQAKVLYEQYDKPMMVDLRYKVVAESWRGSPFYHTGEIPGAGDPMDAYVDHAYSGEDQARTVNGYMAAIADRPWVVGYFHFGYWHWDMPLLPDWSVSGKPAEDVLRKWGERITRGG